MLVVAWHVHECAVFLKDLEKGWIGSFFCGRSRQCSAPSSFWNHSLGKCARARLGSPRRGVCTTRTRVGSFLDLVRTQWVSTQEMSIQIVSCYTLFRRFATCIQILKFSNRHSGTLYVGACPTRDESCAHSLCLSSTDSSRALLVWIAQFFAKKTSCVFSLCVCSHLWVPDHVRLQPKGTLTQCALLLPFAASFPFCLCLATLSTTHDALCIQFGLDKDPPSSPGLAPLVPSLWMCCGRRTST